MHGLGEFSSPGQLASQKSQVFDQEGGLEIVLTPYCTDMENDTPCRRVTDMQEGFPTMGPQWDLNPPLPQCPVYSSPTVF